MKVALARSHIPHLNLVSHSYDLMSYLMRNGSLTKDRGLMMKIMIVSSVVVSVTLLVEPPELADRVT